MKKTFMARYNYGDSVVLKTEPEIKRQVSGYTLRRGLVQYGLVVGTLETWHQEFEIESFCEKKVGGFRK